MDIDEKMSLAVEHARVALQNSEMPIAAIVFLDNKVVAKAYTTEKMEKRYLVHAELNALIDADKRGYAISERKKMQLFTTLEPCLMCFGAAMSFFIGEIYFSLSAPDDGSSRLIDFDKFDQKFLKFQKPVCTGGIRSAESKALFLEYMKKVERGIGN